MSDIAIRLNGLGKMYRLYRSPYGKLFDAFGIKRLMPWRKNYFQEFWSLRDINLEVHRGERLGIVGRNGAGKSTLLKLITHNLEPTEGNIHVAGKIQALMELGTGFHPEFTGRQNIHASLSYHGLSPAEIKKKEDEIVDFSELGDFIDQPVKIYSAGMYARLAFSTATSIKPDILIIDEILGAGDAYFATKCLDRMRTLTEDFGATVLFVSHDLGSVQQICDRAVWIDRGRLLADGSPGDIVKMYYADILEQDKIRLRTRNANSSKVQQLCSTKNQLDQENHEILFRLITQNGAPPQRSHPIRRLTMIINNTFKLSVEPGQPMDNDPSQTAYLLTDREFMNWSDVKTFLGGRVRCFENVGGQYIHAPFLFRLHRDIWSLGVGLELEIEHAVEAEENVVLDLWDGNQYLCLGTLTPKDSGWRIERFSAFSPKSPAENISPAPLDKWETVDAAFSSITPIDVNGLERTVISKGESFGFSILVDIRQPLLTCCLVAVVFDMKGNVVSVMKHHFEETLSPRTAHWRLMFPAPRLRQGEYVWSFDLVPHYDEMATEKMPFYCHWNRCVTIRIEEGYYGHVPLGIMDIGFEINYKLQ